MRILFNHTDCNQIASVQAILSTPRTVENNSYPHISISELDERLERSLPAYSSPEKLRRDLQVGHVLPSTPFLLHHIFYFYNSFI